MAEVHSDQSIYLTDPCPTLPERRSLKGKAPTLPVAQVDSLKACQWAAQQPASAWRRLTMREGEKGYVVPDRQLYDPPNSKGFGRFASPKN